jgi:hypothetical protein
VHILTHIHTWMYTYTQYIRTDTHTCIYGSCAMHIQRTGCSMRTPLAFSHGCTHTHNTYALTITHAYTRAAVFLAVLARSLALYPPSEVAQMIRHMFKEQGKYIQASLKQREPHRSGESGGFAWMLTYAARDCLDFAVTLITTLLDGPSRPRFLSLGCCAFFFLCFFSVFFFFPPCMVALACADDENRAVVVGQLEAMTKFFIQSDLDRDRKHAAITFAKQLKRVLRLELKGLDEFASDAISERAQNLVDPPYKRFSERARQPQARSTPSAQPQRGPALAPAPYYQQPQQQLYASPSRPACPPGFQLTPISPASAAPAAPPGGGRPPSRGIAATKPGESFPASHFSRPCTYCSHAGHAGDTCWKTYPELRALNGL